MRLATVVALLALAGCPKTAPPQAAAAPAPAPAPAEAARPMPGPLPTPAFKMPQTETRTLSNGLKVVVATNHEVPLFNVRLVLDVGDWAIRRGRTAWPAPPSTCSTRGPASTAPKRSRGS